MRSLATSAAAAAILAVTASDAQRVKHLVVLQMENRAFDHMLGYLSRQNPEIRGLTGQEFNYANPADPTSDKIYVSDDAAYVDPSPEHGLIDTANQIYGNSSLRASEPETMTGFVHNYAKATNASFAPNVMKCFNPSDVPVISTLATEFALIDAFYAAVPGPTFPNRLFTLSGTSYGSYDNSDIMSLTGYPQQSIFGALDSANVTWRVYAEEVSTALLFKDMRTLAALEKQKLLSEFQADCAAGDLPQFTFVDPAYFDFGSVRASDQHPAHDVLDGERFMKSVYESLRASPLWNETALVLVYDEHGGFYDSVTPPTEGVPSPDNHIANLPTGSLFPPNNTFAFNALGVRVPAIVISPWVPKGQVIHEPAAQYKPTSFSQYELSSIPATVHKMFNTHGFLTARDAWAATLNGIWEDSPLTEPRTDCPMTLPTPPTDSPAFVGRDRTGLNMPLSGLQRELLTLAHGVIDLTDDPEVMYQLDAANGLHTEYAASAWIRENLHPKLGSKSKNTSSKNVKEPVLLAATE